MTYFGNLLTWTEIWALSNLPPLVSQTPPSFSSFLVAIYFPMGIRTGILGTILLEHQVQFTDFQFCVRSFSLAQIS